MHNKKSILYLLIGFILLIFSNGIHTIIPIATWLAPIFLLRFTRRSNLLFFLPVNVLAWIIMTYNLYGEGMPIWVGLITGIIYGLIFFIPYLVDKKIKVKGFYKTLVFPLAIVTIEYLVSLTPLNSWFSLAYTQYNPILMQLGSITGYLGISFMIAWLASTINWTWENKFKISKIKSGLITYASIFVIIILFGVLYLSFTPANSDTVTVATIVRDFDMDVEASKCNKDVVCLEKLFNRSLNEFLEDSGGVNADIIVWQENALAVYKKDEDGFIDKVKEFAIDKKVYLVVGMYVLSEDRKHDENKAYLITPEGETIEYLKNYLTPGDNHLRGDGKILVHDSEYGKLGLIICQDAHYVNFVKQAKEVDIMIILNHNWESITPYYAKMTFYRAIEQGFNVISAAYHGHSGTLDPKVTGCLPIAVDKATRVVQSLLTAGKEYVCVMHLHDEHTKEEVLEVFKKFTGRIKQLPPVKSAVKRRWRYRKVYYIELLGMNKQDVLFKAGTEAGTYIRKLVHDIGQTIGGGAHMAELRRSKAGPFSEDTLITLQQLSDAFHYYEKGDETKLKEVVQPMEAGVAHLPKVYVMDSAVDSLVHGAQLKVPGIVKVDSDIKEGENVAVLTLKNELILVGEAKLKAKSLIEDKKGIAVKSNQVFMQVGIYPKMEL